MLRSSMKTGVPGGMSVADNDPRIEHKRDKVRSDVLDPVSLLGAYAVGAGLGLTSKDSGDAREKQNLRQQSATTPKKV